MSELQMFLFPVNRVKSQENFSLVVGGGAERKGNAFWSKPDFARAQTENLSKTQENCLVVTLGTLS